MKILIIGGCGYIGSRIFLDLKSKGYHIDTVDLELFGNKINRNNFKIDYENLSVNFLKDYSSIILLAGHSSVPMANASPRNALYNNIFKFYDFIEKLNSNQRLFYASSSSVYSGTGSTEVSEDWDKFNVKNMYDLTKYMGDAIVSTFHKKINYYGLRFGTVCGSSLNFRKELMINGMTSTAILEGEVNIQNKHIHRPILGLNDLSRAFETLILNESAPTGFYNLASFNTTVDTIAKEVSRLVGVPINYQKDTEAYDFSMSTQKFENNFLFEFKDTPSSIVKEIVSMYSADEFNKRRSFENINYDFKMGDLTSHETTI